MTVLLWVDALLFSFWFLTAVLCVRECRLMPSSPQKMSLSRSASSWTPARELGLALPPGGQNHHLQLHCSLTLITHHSLSHTHTLTHTCDYSFCMAHLLGKLPTATGAYSFHTIVVHCKNQHNKSTVFISWYWISMLMLKLVFCSIKHRQIVIYDSLVQCCQTPPSVYL